MEMQGCEWEVGMGMGSDRVVNGGDRNVNGGCWGGEWEMMGS